MRGLAIFTALALVLTTAVSRAGPAAGAGSSALVSPAVLAALAAAEGDEAPIDSALRIYEKAEWSGALRLGVTLQRGNVDSALVDFSADVQRTWTVDKLTAGARYRWGEQEDEKTSSYASVQSRFTHHYSRTLFGYASGKAERDDVADLSLRATLGVGAGLSVWRASDDEFLDLSAGIAILHEDYEGQSPDTDPAGEVGLELGMLLGEAKLRESFTAIAPLGDFDRYILQSLTTLTYPLGGSWNLENSLAITYVGDPPSGTDRLDLVLTIGLSYTF